MMALFVGPPDDASPKTLQRLETLYVGLGLLVLAVTAVLLISGVLDG